MSRVSALRIADQYFGVAADVVRDVVETHLLPLADALRGQLADG